ncbi:hypothetical protein AAIG87_36800, partial [Pseudomonas aeruginosa]
MSQSLFSQPLNVINVGIAMFSDDLKKQHVEVTQLDWTPPGLDVDVIEAELAKLAEQPIEKDWRSAPLAEIIDHIIVRYHDRHREQL